MWPDLLNGKLCPWVNEDIYKNTPEEGTISFNAVWQENERQIIHKVNVTFSPIES